MTDRIATVPELIIAALRSVLKHPKNPEAFAHAHRVIDFYDAAPTTTGESSMTLEAAIAENTTAIHALIAQLAAGSKAPAPAKAAAAAPPAPAPAADPAAAAGAAAPAATAAPTVADCSTGTVALAASHGRDAAVALLARHGVKKGSELKPEQAVAFWNELQVEVAKPKPAAKAA